MRDLGNDDIERQRSSERLKMKIIILEDRNSPKDFIEK